MANEKIGIGYGVSLELAPMGVHIIAPEVLGEMVILQPPRIDDWTVARGAHKQKLEIGGSLLEISYLLGSAREKVGCGDANMIMAMAVPGALAIISETDDYLSQPKNDPKWARVLGTRYRNSMVGEYPGGEEEIRWTRADVAGADLQRKFLKHEQAIHLKRRWSDSLSQITSDMRPMRWGSFEFLPIQEKAADLMLMDWLQARNDYRYGRLKELINEINRYGDVWRNYWLNAAVAVLGMVIDTRPKNEYQSRHAGVAEVVSNADILQLWSANGLYYGYDPVYFELDRSGLPGVGDINRKYDKLAKQLELATENGLVGDAEYHEKTALDGVYMTWGPKNHNGREWLTWAIPRAFHDTQSEHMGIKGKTIFAQGTDGVVYELRDPDREVSKASKTFAERARILVDDGPEALARKVVNTEESPKDDYSMVVVEVTTNEKKLVG